MNLDLGLYWEKHAQATLGKMKIDLLGFEIWETLNAKISSEIGATPEATVRCYAGIAAAVFELAQGAAQFYSHKRSVALIGGRTPHFQSVLPYLYKEGYEVQIAPENSFGKEWVEDLKKDTCFALVAEDHPVTGELYDLTELEKTLNDRKIYCLKISHHNHLFREVPIQPYSARICSFDPQTAVALIGARLRAPPMIASHMDWDVDGFVARVQHARRSHHENREAVEKFEADLPKGFSAFLHTPQRCFDRALIYTESASGEALQQFIASTLGLQVQRPGWETRIETTNLCRWGGVRNYEDWWKPRPAESILRGLLILGTEILETPEMKGLLEKALRECQIAELS